MQRAPALRIHHDEPIVDNFAGGGGASLGIEWALGRSPDVAVNHDAEAIAMHQANHPRTRHFTEDIWKVDPREVCRSRPALAWFSPDCKHFSKAKGGKPVDKKIRGLAWIVLVWAKTVRPRVILLENVEEFEDWGPLGPDNRPDPAKIGLTFRIWKGKLEALGYKVEHREIVASVYGAATTRKRLYLIARCDGLPIVWPKESTALALTDRRLAADCIDWSLPTYSIFLTKREAKPYKIIRPLADNTMRRIARGLQKFVIDNPTPFIVPYWGGGKDRRHELSAPLRTVMADPRYSLVTPYVARIGHTGSHRGNVRGVRSPISTITSKAEHLLCAPTLIQTGYGERKGQLPRALNLQKPLGTVVGGASKHALVAAFLAKHNAGHEATGQLFGSPMHTVVGRDQKALVTSSIVKLKGTARDGQQLDLPLHTVQAGGNHYAETRAFLLKYYGPDQDPRLAEPLHTITSRDRHGIVTVHGDPYVIADIGMRMLAPRELFAAQGFHDDYIIDPVVNGRRLPKDAQVRCVGNSVCPPVAAALARAQFEDQVIEVAA
jgi:DNA (cytosine-5)-methyltransferase 1